MRASAISQAIPCFRSSSSAAKPVMPSPITCTVSLVRSSAAIPGAPMCSAPTAHSPGISLMRRRRSSARRMSVPSRSAPSSSICSRARSRAARKISFGLVVWSTPDAARIRSAGTRPPRARSIEVCVSEPSILCVLSAERSAPAAMADGGSSCAKAKCAPCALSVRRSIPCA